MRKTFNRATLLSGLALLGLAAFITRLSFGTSSNGDQLGPQTVSASVQYLARAMDQFHNRFPVYDDVSSAGNHFHMLTKFPDPFAMVTINGSYSLDKHSGATAIRCTFTPGGANNFGGFNFQNGVMPNGAVAPVPNFGAAPNAGYDLTGATTLTFWARGQQGGEVVDFFMGGVGWVPNSNPPMVNNPCTPTFPGQCPFPDSTPAVKITVTLTTQWTQYTIDLAGKNLSYVLGGFAWGVNGALNPGGATFFLDDVQYNLSPTRQTQRLNEPHFIVSFSTAPFQPNLQNCMPGDGDIDLVLRNNAFIYDNALAVLAFLAEGSADSLRRAGLIGNAIVYATEHDRTFNDGRMRSAYAAGDISLPPGWTPTNRVGTVPVAGYYIDVSQQFCESLEARTFDTGNQAWAMVALLALHRRTGDVRYLDAARLLGNLIHTFRNDTGLYHGFLGGLEYRNGDAAQPFVRAYASTEHNLDIYAAFTVMFNLTGEAVWQADAQHAKQFVESMWDSGGGCYLAGTLDPDNRNTDFTQLPLDVQPWSVLALPDALTLHPQLFNCAEINHRTLSDGFTGFDFNTDKDGIWFEGTGHMATAYAWANQLSSAESYRQELNRAQTTPPFGDGFGITAASHDAISTGFAFKLFRRLHVGATAWHVFAQLGFNPYYQLRNPGKVPFDFDGDNKTDIAVWHPGDGTWYIINSSNGSTRVVQWGASGQPLNIPVAGDYDGDGKADIAVWHPGDGTWYIINSLDGSTRIVQWGASGQPFNIPVPADYDGDGKTDIAVWHPGDGTWYIINSSNGSTRIVQWGASGQPFNVPVPADYDGDGKADIAVWHPGDGTWFIINSSNGSTRIVQWGASGQPFNIPVPGDYDGDGRADIAVWNPGSGYWYIVNSSDGSTRVVQWGSSPQPFNVPVPGDYDGDGKTDLAVWHPGDGTWYIINSWNGSVRTVQWGASGQPFNVPIPGR